MLWVMFLGCSLPLDGKQDSGSYAPASHTHSEGDVTGLSARLSDIEARLDALEGA